MTPLEGSQYEITLEVYGQFWSLRMHPEGSLECFVTLAGGRRRERSFAVLERDSYLPLELSRDGDLYRVAPSGVQNTTGRGEVGAELPVAWLDAALGTLRVENPRGEVILETAAPAVAAVTAPRDGGAGGPDGADAERSPAARAVEARRAVARDGVRLAIKSDQDACFYGLGERTGALDKRGRTYQMWNSDDPFQRGATDPLYQSIPLLLQSRNGRCDGVFLDFPGRSWFDVADTDPSAVTITAEDDAISFFVIPGPTPADAVKRYTALSGRMLLPPLWALGYHQSRYSYYPDHRVQAIAEQFRDRDIPCDAVYLDIHYMDEYRVFTWDPTRFPRPDRLIEELHRLGMRVVTIVDPGVKVDAEYATFADGMRRDVFARSADGSLYRGEVWPGEAAFPDFTKREARRFWSEQHQELFRHGVDGVWNDMNEPADFTGDFFDRTRFTPPSNVVLEADGRPRSIDHYHNVYGNLMCRATADAFARYKPEERPFILTRAGYAGIQRLAAVWTGDNDSSWDHLAVSIPMLLNMGLSGIAFVGADVGGFQGNADPELFARWMQAAALTPFMRGHTALGTRDHEPWSFGPRVERIACDAIRLRYSLLPYLYACFVEAHRTGLPVMRPLVLEFFDDPRCRRIWDQFMCGDALLVAPVLQPATERRLVYLPRGEWYELADGEHLRHERRLDSRQLDERLSGERDVVVDTPLERLPVYVRAGTVLARRLPQPSTAAAAEAGGELELAAYLHGADRPVRSVLFDDDGVSNDHYDGRYRETVFELSGGARAALLRIAPAQLGYEPPYRAYRLTIHGLASESLETLRLELVGGAGARREVEFQIADGRPRVRLPVPSEPVELQMSW